MSIDALATDNPRIMIEMKTSLSVEAVTQIFRNHNFKVNFITLDCTAAILRFRYNRIAENSKTILRNTPVALVMEAILDIKKVPDLDVISYWVGHDETVSKNLIHSSSAMHIDPISSYYGPEIATYFAWLQYYQNTLRFPCLAGLILFFQEMYFKTTELTLIPFFGVALALWSTVFVQFWKRRNASLRMAWGIDVSEQYLDAEDLSSQRHNKKEYRSSRLMLSYSCVGMYLTGCLAAMLYLYDLYVVEKARYGALSFRGNVPLVIYSILPGITGAIFSLLAKRLTEFEKPLTEGDRQRGLLFKKFALAFVNKFCSLLYVTFWLQDLGRVRSALIIMLIGDMVVVSNVIEVSMPVVTSLMKQKKVTSLSGGLKAAKEEFSKYASPVNANNPQPEASTDYAEFLAQELTRPTVDVDEEYLELVTQFGYVTMFAVAFPLAPLLAMVSNYFEFKVDLVKLAASRRPLPQMRSTIGAWANCLEFIGFISIFTNLFLLSLSASNLIAILPKILHHHLDAAETRFVIIVGLEHVVFILKVLLMVIIPEQSTTIAKERIRLRRAGALTVVAEQANALQQSAPVKSKHIEDQAEDAQRGHTFQEKLRPLLKSSTGIRTVNPTLEREKEEMYELAVAEFSKQMAAEKVKWIARASSQIDYYAMFPMLIVPTLFQLCGVHPLIYVPIAALYLMCLRVMKRRADITSGAMLVTDSSVLNLIVDDLPGWLVDSDKERVDWLNSIVRKLWPFVQDAVGRQVKESANEIIGKNIPPSIFTSAELKTAFLGSVPPSIQYIKYVHNPEKERACRFDVDVIWVGDPEFTLEFGINPIPLIISLTNLQVKATIRVELVGLHNTLPCIDFASVTMMREPLINFSLKIANMDVMSIPSLKLLRSKHEKKSDTTALLAGWIQSILSRMLLYPKRILIPLSSGKDSALSYLLTVKVVSCANLIACDLNGKSDPYIELSHDDQTFKTKVVFENLNPTFNETFTFVVKDLQIPLQLQGFDHDNFSTHDSLGLVECDLKSLELGEVVCDTIPFSAPPKKSFTTTAAFRTSKQPTSFGTLTLELCLARLDDNREVQTTSEDSDEDDVSTRDHGSIGRRPSSRSEIDGLLNTPTSPSPSAMGRSTKSSSPAGAALTQRTSLKQSRGIVKINKIACTDVKMKSIFMSGAMKVYVEFSCEGQVKKTSVIQSTSPQFLDEFQFTIQDPTQSCIHIAVKEFVTMGSHKLLGAASVPVQDIVARGTLSYVNNTDDMWSRLLGASLDCHMQWLGVTKLARTFTTQMTDTSQAKIT